MGVEGYQRYFNIIFTNFVYKIQWEVKVNFIGKKHEENSDLLKIVCKFKLLTDKHTETIHTYTNIYIHIYTAFENSLLNNE